MPSPVDQPVILTGRLEPGLSRWLWLVKWLLLVPHVIVLFFLWIALGALSVVAWFAILFTGCYPRTIFDFNLGVLRWSWRVSFYSYGALGTDRYPPFTLDDVPDYPARLEVAYPERLSRGLVLVKSWLLAIPHLLVLGFFLGIATYSDHSGPGWPWSAGLVGLLVLVAGVVLLFAGRYPRGVFDLVLGMDRWVARVGAYVLLMTDAYPPFRLDQGGGDLGPPRFGPPLAPAAAGRAAVPPTVHSGRARWNAWRLVGVSVGSVALALGLAAGLAGGALLYADKQLRDEQGFLMSGNERFTTSSYAVTTGSVHLTGGRAVHALVGDLKVTVSGTNGPVFVGIAPSPAVDGYLAGVGHAVVTDVGQNGPRYRDVAGGSPTGPPGSAGIWQASTAGSGTQTLQWGVQNGTWTAVLMNADGSPNVAADIKAGATLPALGWGAAAGFIAAAALFAVGLLLVLLSLPRRPMLGPPAPRAPAPPPLSGAVP